MAKHSSSRKKQARRLGRTARGLHQVQKQVKSVLGSLQHWPYLIQNMDAQIATLTAIVSVYQYELEKLGVTDLKAKFTAKAKEIVEGLRKQDQAKADAA